MMKINKIIFGKKISVYIMLVLSIGILTGCNNGNEKTAEKKPDQTVDGVASASVMYYESSSLTNEQLFSAIEERSGGCTIASVNADGSPNLIVAVPGTADGKYIYFTWAENMTKENAKRTGEVEICYYLYDAKAETKEERNTGARARLGLVKDQSVIDQLAKENPMIASATVFEIREILPIG